MFTLIAFSLNVAFASDVNNNTDISTQSDDLIGISNSQVEVSTDNEGSFSDLNSLIAYSDSSDTISIEKNYTCSSSDSQSTISKALTIDGNGYALNGNDAGNIIKVSDDVTLIDINFINGAGSSSGGAIFSSVVDSTVSNLATSNVYTNETGESSTSTNYFTDLANLISSASDYLTLTQDYVYNSTVDGDYVAGIVIDKTLTIDGAGYTIDANSLARIFNVTSDDVIIKNINFVNGYYNNGSGQASCVLWNGDNGELTDCNFTDSYAKIGGAVLWLGDEGLVDGCNFTSNSAMTTAGAIYWDGNNGRINNSYFGKNHVTTKGGALYSSYNDNLTVENCIFDSNYASLFAGAIAFDYVSANIINTSFTGNYLVWSLNGGAIQFTGNSSNLCNLTNCIFESNRAGTGSSIYSTIPLNIQDSSFADSDSVKTIVTTSNLTLSGNTLSNDNTIYVNGGEVLSPTNVVLNSSSSKIDVGSTVTLSGIIYDDNDNIIILNSIDFIVNDESVKATFKTDGTFTADYTISEEESYTVSINTTGKLSDATINTIVLTNDSVENLTISVVYAIEPVAIVNISSVIDGTFNVSVGGKNSTVEVSNGVAYAVFILDAGDYNLTVSKEDSEDYTGLSKTISFTVNNDKIASLIEVTLIGGDYTVEGVLKDINGNVIENAIIDYTVNGEKTASITTDANGIFSFNAGENGVVEISYSGDDSTLSSSTSITLENISSDKTNPTLNLSVSDYSLGQDVVVSVDAGDATGNITFIVNGVDNVVNLENGVANYTISQISGGEYVIVAVYSGDETYNAGYNTTSFNLETFSTGFANITVNEDLTISAVLINSLGDAISNAVISYSIGDLSYNTTTDADGSFSITAKDNVQVIISYGGNGTFVGNNISIKLNSIVPSSVKVNSRFNITGNAITITGYAVDTKAGETGMSYSTVLFDNDGNPLSNASIQFAVNNKIYNRTTYENGSFLPYNLNMVRAGRYTMAFFYGGNDMYNSTFACVCVDLDKKPITISASAKTYKSSATKKYTVTLKTIAGSSSDGKVYLSTKKVTLKINGKTYTAKTSNGKATFNIKLTRRGIYSAEISFEGDKTYEAATKTVKITIK